MMANYQTANTLDNSATEVVEIGTNMFNANLGYRVNLVLSGISVNTSLNYSEFTTGEIKNKTIMRE